MKLAYYCMEQPIEFIENFINVLIIENPKTYRDFLTMLTNAIEGYDTDLILSDNKELSIEKYVELILSPFSLEINNKRILNKLNEYLSKSLDDYEEKYNKVAYSMNQFGSDIAMMSQYPIVYSEIQSVQQVIKALEFRIDDELPMNEQIVEYMRLNRDMLGKKLFVFVGLKSFFVEQELKLLYNDIIAEKFNVLLLEGYKYPYRIDAEKTHIIDYDLCELY